MVWKPDVTVAAVVERDVRCMEDYLAGIRAPLDLLVDYN